MGSLMSGWSSSVRKDSLLRCTSLTKQEIESFWRTKRLIEEIYEFAKQLLGGKQSKHRETNETGEESMEEEEEESRVIGIKDWWTKSSHAFLNQPPLKTMEEAEAHKYRYTAQYNVANTEHNDV